MAEIKIEKKKSVWLWVLVVLGIAALIIYFAVFNDSNKEITEVPGVTAEETVFIDVKENNSTVTAYVTFVEDDMSKMELDHAYTNEALLKLVAATNAMAGEVGYSVKEDMDKVKELAELITVNPLATTHANNIREATDILSTVLQNIQQAKYPGLSNEAAQLRDASSSINPDVLTLDEKDAVKSFFSSAADLLKKMN